MRVGFIGAGKVGFSLGKYLALGAASLSGYHSRTMASAEEAARFTGSRAFFRPGDLVAASDIVFLTVPDYALGGLWAELRFLGISGRVLCHTSGSLSSGVFEGIAGTGAEGASLHPLMALPDKLSSHALLRDAIFTLEGGPKAVGAVGGLMRPFGNSVLPIDPSAKVPYHAAASIVSNFSVALARAGAGILSGCGLSEAAPGLWGLMLANARSIQRLGPVGALTGPVERGDLGTVAAHLGALSGEDRELYLFLARRLVAVAKEKHPGRDYGPMLGLLGGAG
jgi:predicted short-subunit dehydrogenase-like oxidoreductase (DUF2520 family)